MPEAELPRVVSEMITLLDLSKHYTRLCGTYSGGNKRKLSTAVALIGNPPIVFLDEPTRCGGPARERATPPNLNASGFVFVFVP